MDNEKGQTALHKAAAYKYDNKLTVMQPLTRGAIL